MKKPPKIKRAPAVTPKRSAQRRSGRGEINWAELKVRYMAREWPTITAMIETLQLNAGTTRSKCNGWLEERDEYEAVSHNKILEMVATDRETMLRDMIKRQLEFSLQLQMKASNRLFGKYRDENGMLRQRDFDNDAVALAAMRLGVGMEQSLLKLANPGDDRVPTFDLANLSGAVGGTGEGNSRRLREYSAEDLASILSAPDDPGTKKAGGQGNAGAEAGGKKRS